MTDATDQAERALRATRDAGAASVRTGGMWPGTVTSYDAATDKVYVTLDSASGATALTFGDVASATVGALDSPAFVNMAERPWTDGMRVMCQLDPPHGGYVIGGIGKQPLPGWEVQYNGGGVLGNGVEATLSFDTEVFDPYGYFNVGVSNTTIVCSVPGAYSISYGVSFGGNPGIGYLDTRLNGTYDLAMKQPSNTLDPANTWLMSGIMRVPAGGVVTVQAWIGNAVVPSVVFRGQWIGWSA